MRYAIINSKFHGGGILFETSSPRELLRALPRYKDGCFDGNGCQSLAASDDGGETWYQVMIEHCDPISATHVYSDMALYVDDIEIVRAWGQIRPAYQTESAISPAL